MKKILMVPLNIFIYAGKGVKYLLKGFNKKETVKDINKLQGDTLEKELQRVNIKNHPYKGDFSVFLVYEAWIVKKSNGDIIVLWKE